MEVSIHLRNLENLCRICCQKLDKTRRCKELVYFKKVLLEYFDVDVETDTPDVYPTCVCERCRKVLSKVEKFSKKNIVTEGTLYRPQLSFFHFKPHADQCYICESSFKAKKGGRPPLKSWTNKFNIVSDNVIESTSTKPSNVCFLPSKDKGESSLFDIDVIANHSQKLGYAYIPTEIYMSFIIFHKPQGMMQLDVLVTVNIDKNSHSWNVLIGTKDVSSNKSFSSRQPVIYTSNDAVELLSKCSKLNFCIGNEDFSEVCCQKKK